MGASGHASDEMAADVSSRMTQMAKEIAQMGEKNRDRNVAIQQRARQVLLFEASTSAVVAELLFYVVSRGR